MMLCGVVVVEGSAANAGLFFKFSCNTARAAGQGENKGGTVSEKRSRQLLRLSLRKIIKS